MTDLNRCWRLAARPQGMLKDSDFTWHESPIPELTGEGQILVRTLYLSVDPAQRSWTERETYIPAVPLGEVMYSAGIGRVVRSTHPGFSEGDLLTGMIGWQDYAVLTSGPFGPHKIPPGVPLPAALSVLGITALTAYFGLLDVGRAAPGETVVVSGAAGATGMMAGQIAKIKGCRVTGIAGGPDKCAWLTGSLGFDAAIDYKTENVWKRLGDTCPKGVDVFFDNVGGEILDAALGRLAMRGRVVICGGISGYNDLGNAYGPRNYINLIVKRGRMEGFIVFDFAERFGEALQNLVTWLGEGRLQNRVTVAEGLQNAPAALRGLFTGANIGKQLVHVAD